VVARYNSEEVTDVKKKIDLMMKHPLVDVLIVMLVISLIGMGSYAFFNISTLSRGTFEQTAFSKRNPPTYRFIAIVEQGDLAYAEKIKQGMDEAASTLGVAYEFWGIEGTDKEEKLLRQLDIALLSGVDGILVQSRNTDGFSELLRKAIELGVPVVTLGEDVVSAEKVSHFGINTYAMGSRLVEVLEKEVGLDSYGGDLLILQGNPMVMKDFC
jgi:ABC-type sugar transport system substrate-binding protein